MLEEIRRNPKVEELATNPLMLVIFALIRHWAAAKIALPLNAPAAVEIYARALDPNSLASCRKVLAQQRITEDEGRLLAALVRAKPKETSRQQEARVGLFNWLFARLESQASARPV